MARILKTILFLLFAVTLITPLLLKRYFEDKESYKNWVECIKAGSGSEEDCARCDMLFQPEGKRYTMPD